MCQETQKDVDGEIADLQHSCEEKDRHVEDLLKDKADEKKERELKEIADLLRSCEEKDRHVEDLLKDKTDMEKKVREQCLETEEP